MQQSQINTFSTGMDQDTAKSKYQPTSYLELQNGKVVGSESASSFIITNEEGNSEFCDFNINIPSSSTLNITKTLYASFSGLASQYTNTIILGTFNFKDDLIVFTKHVQSSPGQAGQFDCVWLLENIKNLTQFTLNVNRDLKYIGNLGLNTDFRIKKCIGNYEYGNTTNGGWYKIYWTDGLNQLKHLNLFDNKSYGYRTNCINISETDLNIIPTTIGGFGITYEFLPNSTTGDFKAGVVQYSYKLLNSNSNAETSFFPCTDMYQLTLSSYSDTTTTNFTGSDKDVNTLKSVNLRLNNIPNIDFNQIQFVALFYDTINSTPVIRITDKINLVTSTIDIIDKGDISLFKDTISLAAFTKLTRSLFVCQDLEVKNNMLVAGNIRYDNSFDVDYDARTYRFNSSGQGEIRSSLGNVTLVTSGNISSIPSNHDCITPTNILGYANDNPTYTHQINGTELGGTGPNISYKFVVNTILSEDGGEVQSTGVNIDNVQVSKFNNTYPNYASPLNSGRLTGYQRDEIYSFAIILYDNFNRKSFPKWIGDIRFPKQFDVNGTTTYSKGGTLLYDYNIAFKKNDNKNYINILGIQFTINNLPSNIKAYEIVRCERKQEDRSISYSGIGQYCLSKNLVGDATVYAGLGENVSEYANVAKSTEFFNILSPQACFFSDEYSFNSNDYVITSGIFGLTLGNNFFTKTNLFPIKNDGVGFVKYTGIIPTTDVKCELKDGLLITELDNFNNTNILIDNDKYKHNAIYGELNNYNEDKEIALYFSTGYRISTNPYTVWSTPLQLGPNMTGTTTNYVVYSIDGSTNWHTTFAASDNYMQYQISGGSLSTVIPIKNDSNTTNSIQYGFNNSDYFCSNLTTLQLVFSINVTYTTGIITSSYSSTVNAYTATAPNSIFFQYSADNSTWHSTIQTGDIYCRGSINGVYASTSIPSGSILNVTSNIRYAGTSTTYSNIVSTSTVGLNYARVSSSTTGPWTNLPFSNTLNTIVFDNLNSNAVFRRDPSIPSTPTSTTSLPAGWLDVPSIITGNYQRTTILKDKGTALVLKGISNSNISSLQDLNKKYIYYKRNVVPYGGNTYIDRLNREYIQTSQIFANSINTITVFEGDTFINYFSTVKNLYHPNTGVASDLLDFTSYHRIVTFPVESPINLDIRTDKILKDYKNTTGAVLPLTCYPIETKSLGTTYFPTGVTQYENLVGEDYYRYNSVYSQQANSVISVPSPLSFTPQTDFGARVIISTKRILGDLTDQWLDFKTEVFKDLDASLGKINALKVFKDQLLVFQDLAFAILPVEERIMTADLAGNNVILGDGDILGKYGYITKLHGCRNQSSIINTDNLLFYYDDYNKKVLYFDGQENKQLSVISGMNSFFTKNLENLNLDKETITASQSFGVSGNYDKKNNRILFTFHSNNSSKTIGFNLILNKFESFYSYYPKHYSNAGIKMLTSGYTYTLDTNGNFLSKVENTSKLFIHSDIVSRNTFYGNGSKTLLKLLINANPNILKTLTNVEFNSVIEDIVTNYEYFDNNGNPEKLTSIRIYNDYQDSGKLLFIDYSVDPDIDELNIRRLMRSWRLKVPRASTGRGSSLDRIDSRFKNQDFTIELEYSGNKKLILNDITSYFII